MTDEDMNNSILASPLAALRAELARHDTPAGVEQELMQAFAHTFPPRRRWYQRLHEPRFGIAGSLASVALVVLVFTLSPGGVPVDGAAALPQAAGTLAQASRDDRAFIALDSLERIQREPAPRLVQTQVPRTTLAPLGVAITPENAGDSVKAEMLVSADGEPLALRLTSLDDETRGAP
ncbi:hypothetical protein NX774_16535 [Massilia agilis]|uniref:Uncharacterized protein n=1 Tax=Massilia agilis TaxID=1811226 RepID=A0ABT2DDY5_9BURK|nr:hypothetical protein [Massilia agilis]MCS0809533.1 hypothetical protein [Massilia agilis]